MINQKCESSILSAEQQFVNDILNSIYKNDLLFIFSENLNACSKRNRVMETLDMAFTIFQRLKADQHAKKKKEEDRIPNDNLY